MMVVAIMATLVVFGFVVGTHKNQIIDWYEYGCELAIGEINNDEFFNRAIRLSTEKAENLKAESNRKGGMINVFSYTKWKSYCARH
jgi:hypothetical protein